MPPISKIVVIGPESTGKSTLCERLAREFRSRWAPEYAREYLLTRGKDYDYEDLLHIAKGQIALEDRICQDLDENISTGAADPGPAIPFFVDTDLWVMKVWCEYVFGKCHQWIIDRIASRRYDFYLLCNTDLPWVGDELREYPDLETRELLFRTYKDILVNQETPWAEIKGGAAERFPAAREAVSRFLGR